MVHGSSRSQWVPAPHGLPQGSVLAPLLYIIYTSELGPFLTACALLGQLYADDIQAYLHCLASDAKAAVRAMTLAMGAWMSSNRLRLNPIRLPFQLTFAPHINRLCRNCYYQLHQLRIISCSLTSTATDTLVHAFVTSLLDYCSTLYVGLPAVRLGCLKRVIRTTARLIGGVPRTGHVSAYMLDVLHWLPLQQRIIFSIGVLVWRCILSLAPAYLRDL